jgi:hypothetical protein
MADKPAKGKDAKEAGKAKAGEVLDLQANPAQPGKYTLPSQTVAGGAGGAGGGEDKETYGIVLQLQDDQGTPVGTMPSGAPVRFRIKVAGQLYEGELGHDGDAKGRATISGLPEQSCEVCFPGIHPKEWKKK